MKADFERSWKKHIALKVNRLALFAAFVHWAEGENILSIWTLRFKANYDTGMGVQWPSRRINNLGGTSRPNVLYYWSVGPFSRSRERTLKVPVLVLEIQDLHVWPFGKQAFIISRQKIHIFNWSFIKADFMIVLQNQRAIFHHSNTLHYNFSGR